MTRTLLALSLGISALFAAGCIPLPTPCYITDSYGTNGTVIDAETGTPVSDAKLEVTYASRTPPYGVSVEDSEILEAGFVPLTSDDDGEFCIGNERHWYLLAIIGPPVSHGWPASKREIPGHLHIHVPSYAKRILVKKVGYQEQTVSIEEKTSDLIIRLKQSKHPSDSE